MVIRDDHLGRYYLDNARCASAGKIRAACAARTMNYAPRVHPRSSSSFSFRRDRWPPLLPPVPPRKSDLSPSLHCTTIDPRVLGPLSPQSTPLTSWAIFPPNERVKQKCISGEEKSCSQHSKYLHSLTPRVQHCSARSNLQRAQTSPKQN